MIQIPRKRIGSTHSDLEWNRMVDYLRSLRPVPSPGTLTSHGVHGVSRQVSALFGGGGQAGSVAVSLFKFVSMDDEMLNVLTADGISGQIWKPYKLRWPVGATGTTTATIDGVTITYSSWDTSGQTRSATDGSITETHVITPRYLVGDLLWAVKVVPEWATGEPAHWMDINADGRAWGKVMEE